MTRAELERASNLLKNATEATKDDVQERFYEQSDQLATLVAREQGPDHGRLARYMTVLRDLTKDLDGDTAGTVREAQNGVLEHRKDVPSV